MMLEELEKENIMELHKIEVKQYMTRKSTPEFDFMAQWNKDIPMPLRVMVGTVEKETRGMVYMKLHGDIYSEKICTCMKCGRRLTNPVSQYFGIGPECGGHGYTNPFDTEEELKAAVADYKAKLNKMTWEGWIIKSAILSDEIIGGEKEPVTAPKVKIEIKDAKQFAGKSAFVSFAYNTDLLDIVRSMSSRQWHKDDKVWEVPDFCYDALIKALKDYDVTVVGEFETKEVETVDYEYKTEPFEHQRESFKFGMEHSKWLLGDEQGLGKTKQAIDIAIAKKNECGYKHCLIVCGVNGLKWNWLKEIETHSDEKGYILGQRVKRDKLIVEGTKAKISDLSRLDSINEYFIITNVESLRESEISRILGMLCADKTIGVVVIDEIHKCKNPSSQQGRGILKLNADYRLALTGTPLMNTPLDLYIILKWLGYEKHSFYAFKNHYCEMGGYGGYEIVGYKNLNELQKRLDGMMLRRVKADVFDLPDKLYVDEYVEMTPQQSKLYTEVLAGIYADIDRISAASNPLAELIRLRQVTGNTAILSSTLSESAKLDRLEELVEDAVSNGKKVVIFSNWTQMTDAICRRFADVRTHNYDYALITGQTNDSDRQAIVDRFQHDDNTKVIIGTIGAMGTGLTLTAGTVEIFVDEPWNNALKEQAVDRCHRIGTTENVTIYTLLCKNTIDERIHELVLKKGAIADALVDGKINGRELVNFLLS